MRSIERSPWMPFGPWWHDLHNGISSTSLALTHALAFTNMVRITRAGCATQAAIHALDALDMRAIGDALHSP